jgi:hypothetical protein
VLFVSHDRWFVSELATRIVEITPDGPRDFPGTYAEYLARLGDDHLDADVVVSRARAEKAEKREKRDDAAPASVPAPAAQPAKSVAPPPAKSAAPPAKGAEPQLSWEEQKRRKNRAKALPRERDELLAEIARLEARKREIEQLWAAPDLAETHTVSQIRGLQYEEADLARTLEGLLQKWEKVEEELASLGVE